MFTIELNQDYLECNKNKKYIDQEDLFRTLYDKYPEYGRKKFKSFKVKLMRRCLKTGLILFHLKIKKTFCQWENRRKKSADF